jgi:hypothetical protein
MRKFVLFAAATALPLLAGFASLPTAEAQSGSRATRQAHHDALWSWLRRVNYRNWNGIDGSQPDFQEGQSPHGALLKTYVSPLAGRDPQRMPHGSVIVKENYSPDKKLMAVTVMQRANGYDPDHGNWYYAKYMPDGTIAKAPPEKKSMPIAGKFQSCIDCHAGADGNDFLYLNDQPALQ